MASSFSSNPSSKSPKKYDAFISFRGEDTRFNFTSHLHYALRSKQIDTYIDYRLDKGEEVWPSLEKAIEHSTLFIVIFSENYASSTWCLRELTKILECSKNEARLVIPVFYRVDPSHVRKLSGSYQRAFEEREHESTNKQQLQKWREALTYAANLSGWHCSFNRNEAEQIIEIVRCVIQKLGCKYQSENDLKEFIGIHKRMADVESLLDKGSNNVQFIGIWGMGGLGKTTLAKTLFNKLHLSYEGFCFLDNVREESKKYGIAALRKKLILKLLGDKESHIGMLDEIRPYAMSRLGRKKNFIVLDDVDDHEQLDNLAGRRDWFGSGSKILITTRDKQVLGKKVDHIYTLEALNIDEAFQLFSLNAFKKDCGGPKITALAYSVTHYAYGNPLALKVLGSSLYGKKQEAWESLLGKLEKFPCPKINDILKLSFEGLDCEEKNIFLDIACFFNGYYVEDVIKLLDACGYSTIIGLESLKDKALLCIYDCERRVSMHNLIKEMGRQIVREESLNDPKRRSRLWDSKEIFEILKKNTGSDTIEGITLNLSEVEEMCLSPQAFCSMPNLKFLNFHKNWNDKDGKTLRLPSGIEFLPSKLRLLHWTEYPLKSLPAQFKVENLVQLEMPHSNLTKLWDGVQNLVNLCKIELPGSKYLIELPDLSKAIHLATVNLNYCSELRSVHPSMLSHHSLGCLWLRECRALTSLTSHTHLKSLVDLDLRGCSRLNKFSVTSENCRFQLKLSGTVIDDKLLSSSGKLSEIDSLFLNDCTSITSLPYKLADLSNIRRLFICGCNRLASNLRLIFDRLHTLEALLLGGCSELFEVPDNISLLSSLRKLGFSGTNIETLPQSIKHLSSLRGLYLNGCKRLRYLPELPPSVLEVFTVNCLSIEFLHLPLMSADGEEKVAYYDDYNEVEPFPYFVFTNCMKLDRQSIKVAEAKVLLEVNKATYDTAGMQYPGERVPEWFMYRTTQSSFTVDLSLIPQSSDDNFIFCVVISKSPERVVVHATWYIDGEYAFNAESSFATHERILLDHVVLWYDPYSFQKLQRKIEEKKTNAQNNNYHPLLQIEFIVDCLDYYPFLEIPPGEIKECGICLTSALEYQNCFQQIQLPLHPIPSSNDMGLGCSFHKKAISRKRKYQSLDEFEEMILSFKALNLNDLTTST